MSYFLRHRGMETEVGFGEGVQRGRERERHRSKNEMRRGRRRL